MIIARTIGLVCLALLQPYKELSKSIAIWLSRQWGLYDGTCPNFLRADKALTLVPSDNKSGLIQSLNLSSLQNGRSITYFGRCFYLLLRYCFYHLTCLCNNLYGISTLIGCSTSVIKRRIIYTLLQCVSFWLHSFCGWWEGWDPVKRFNHTRRVAVVTPTDRPKSVRNGCVIEVFGGFFVLSRCFLDF